MMINIMMNVSTHADVVAQRRVVTSSHQITEV